MTGRGRPLRFLALVVSAWVGVRAAILWPHAESAPQALQAAVPSLAAVPRAPTPTPTPHAPGSAALAIALPPPTFLRVSAPIARETDRARVPLTLAGILRFGEPELEPAQVAQALPPALGRPIPLPAGSRWSSSAWLMTRGGAGIAGSPRLGASQAGFRLAYALDRRLALVARVTAPLEGRGREASIGAEWQPVPAPVRLVAEQRIGLDGTPGGTGLGAIAWTEASLPAGFRLEAYGQTGAIARRRIEPYADGSIRFVRPIANRVVLGIGGWGAAQRGAARLDMGPSLVARLPIAGHDLRLAVDWRERLAGDARPGSGVALTLAADF